MDGAERPRVMNTIQFIDLDDGQEDGPATHCIPAWKRRVALTANGSLFVPPVYQIDSYNDTIRRAEEKLAPIIEDDEGNPYVLASWLAERCDVAFHLLHLIRAELEMDGFHVRW